MKLRTGQGFDLHRLVPHRPFLLGGILIDWPLGPEGHSDGDVLLHAVIDALLGAAGLGDIGDWFSPGDQQFKGANSLDLLKVVLKQVYQEGWQIMNVDMTVLLEVPKLSPYKTVIRQQLATVLELSDSQVNIKAKTMEGLGAIGQQQAVAAMAQVLLVAG